MYNSVLAQALPEHVAKRLRAEVAGFQLDDLVSSPEASPLRPKPAALLRHGNSASKTGNGATYNIFKDVETGSAPTPQRRYAYHDSLEDNNNVGPIMHEQVQRKHRPLSDHRVEHTGEKLCKVRIRTLLYSQFTFSTHQYHVALGCTCQHQPVFSHYVAPSRADGESKIPVLTLEEFSPAPWIDFGHVVVGEGKVRA